MYLWLYIEELKYFYYVIMETYIGILSKISFNIIIISSFEEVKSILMVLSAASIVMKNNGNKERHHRKSFRKYSEAK